MRPRLFKNVKDTVGCECGPAEIDTAIDATATAATISQLRSLKQKLAEAGLGEAERDAIVSEMARLKSTLCAVTFQGAMHGPRSNANAEPTGLTVIDFDHVADLPAAIAAITARREQLGLRAAFVSPSGDGVKVVAPLLEQYNTIWQCQQWYAQQLGLEAYLDASGKDLARLCFLPDRASFIYLDYSIFDDGIPDWFAPFRQQYLDALAAPAAPRVAPAATAPATAVPASAALAEGPQQTTYVYKGHQLQLAEVARTLFDLRCGGQPQQGDRHRSLLGIALQMRYLTDFQPEPIAAAMPLIGKPADEVAAICRYACGAHRGAGLPAPLREALDLLAAGAEVVSEEEALDLAIDFPLPPVLRELYRCAPEDFRHCVLLAALPLIGTLATNLRSRYINDAEQSPTFFVDVIGRQANGKSFVTKIYELLCHPLIIDDRLARAQDEANKAAAKAAKSARTKAEREAAKKELAEQPAAVVRIIPPVASKTKLLERLTTAVPLHCLTVANELSHVVESYKRGSNNLSPILRDGYNNGEVGQDYYSDESFNTIVKCYYNVLYAGTPGVTRKFFANLEDGLVSRFIFTVIEDQLGKPMPLWKAFTPREEEVITSTTRRLYAASLRGEQWLELGWLNAKLSAWLEAQRAIINKTHDRSRDTYYRRAAETAFRAGMVAFALYDYKDTRTVRTHVGQFAIWVANSMLSNLIRFFPQPDEELPAVFAAEVFQSLPATFSRDELTKALAEHRKMTPPGRVLTIWRTAKVITPDKPYGATMFTKNSSLVPAAALSA